MKSIKKITIKFLGTSSGEPIPRIGDDCEQCLSTDKKDKRLRSSILIDKKILVDAGPDILKQLHKNQIEALELVLITHDHYDHASGIKDLLKIKRDLEIIRLKPGQYFKRGEIEFHAFKVKHSDVVTTVGIQINSLIYIPDFEGLTLAEKYLKETKIAVLDGSLLNRSFDGHMSINAIIAATKNLKNLRKIYFTHNGHTKIPHKDLSKIIKALGDDRYFLAYDGMELKI